MEKRLYYPLSPVQVSLLNKASRMSRVPKCLSVQASFKSPIVQVPECSSAQVPWVLEYLSALWVTECLECPSAQVPFECPWNAQFPFEYSFSKKKELYKNGLANSFIEFLKTSQNTYFYMWCVAGFGSICTI